jgi:hypothetical protein
MLGRLQPLPPIPRLARKTSPSFSAALATCVKVAASVTPSKFTICATRAALCRAHPLGSHKKNCFTWLPSAISAIEIFIPIKVRANTFPGVGKVNTKAAKNNGAACEKSRPRRPRPERSRQAARKASNGPGGSVPSNLHSKEGALIRAQTPRCRRSGLRSNCGAADIGRDGPVCHR